MTPVTRAVTAVVNKLGETGASTAGGGRGGLALTLAGSSDVASGKAQVEACMKVRALRRWVVNSTPGGVEDTYD